MKTKTTKAKVTFYKEGDWYWHAKQKGRIKADSGEGYRRKAIAKRSFDRLVAALAAGNFEVEWLE